MLRRGKGGRNQENKTKGRKRSRRKEKKKGRKERENRGRKNNEEEEKEWDKNRRDIKGKEGMGKGEEEIKGGQNKNEKNPSFYTSIYIYRSVKEKNGRKKRVIEKMGSARDRAHARAEVLAKRERGKGEKRLTTESNLGPLTLKAHLHYKLVLKPSWLEIVPRVHTETRIEMLPEAA